MLTNLVRVEAPHFVAGLIAQDGVVIKAAPILGWAVGKRTTWVAEYFRRRGWSWTIVVRTQGT